MLRIFGKAIAQAVLAASMVGAATATAAEKSPSPTQIVPVSQLGDIQTTDWESVALQSLAKGYGCASSSQGSDRAAQPLSRAEFATDLNACLQRINALVAAGTTDLVTDDLATLQRLQVEFAKELTVRGQIDNLEAQTTQLETEQFSTTTQLEGEIILAINGVSGEETADGSGDEINSITLGNRARLDFETSFTGEDQLSFRLQARNLVRFDDVTGTEMTRLGFSGSNDNDFELSELEYRFPIGEQAEVSILDGGGLSDFTSNLNPLLGEIQDSSTGSISRFGQGNPILRQGGDTGIGLSYELSEAVRFGFGYLAEDANDPELGIAGNTYGAIAQVTLIPSARLGIGLTYVRSLNSLDTGTGSERANEPFDGESEDVVANSYGLELSYQVSPAFTLGGWVGLTDVRANDLPGEPEAEIFNYAVTLAFPDLGEEGNMAGLIVGQPPKVSDTSFRVKDSPYQDEDTALHLEAFYLFYVADDIAVTPGVLVVVNPEHQESNTPIYLGTIRFTFSF